jgi:hypothetical protein
MDLDRDPLPRPYDTVMLLSVLHHTQDVAGNARKVAAACRRVFLECRLVEHGSKPIDGVWQETTCWSYGSVEEMAAGLEKMFPGFELKTNHGSADRHRYLLELERTNG